MFVSSSKSTAASAPFWLGRVGTVLADVSRVFVTVVTEDRLLASAVVTFVVWSVAAIALELRVRAGWYAAVAICGRQKLSLRLGQGGSRATPSPAPWYASSLITSALVRTASAALLLMDPCHEPTTTANGQVILNPSLIVEQRRRVLH